MFLTRTHPSGNSPTSVGRNGQEAMSIWGESLLGEARGMGQPCASLNFPCPGHLASYLDLMAISSEKTSATLRPTAPHSPGLGMACPNPSWASLPPLQELSTSNWTTTPGLPLPVPLLTSSPHWMLPESLPPPPQPQLCCVLPSPSPPLEERACILFGVSCSVDHC